MPTSARRTRRASARWADRAPHRRGALPQLPLAGRGRVRAEHDVAQLPAHAGTRAAARTRRRDRLHAARPRRERLALAGAAGGSRRGGRFAGVLDDLSLDLDDLAAQLGPDSRRRVPVASNAVGTTPTWRVVELAHDAERACLGGCRPLRPARHDRRHGVRRRRPPLLAVQVLRASASPSARKGCSRASDPTRCARRRTGPSATAFSTERSSTSCSPDSLRQSSTSSRWAGRRSSPTRRNSDNVPGRGAGRARAVRAADDGARSRPLRSTCPGARRAGRDRAGGAEIAVWHGDYYAVEIMKLLRLEGTGAVRAGFVHYNTQDEVDRLLAALDELA